MGMHPANVDFVQDRGLSKTLLEHVNLCALGYRLNGVKMASDYIFPQTFIQLLHDTKDYAFKSTPLWVVRMKWPLPRSVPEY